MKKKIIIGSVICVCILFIGLIFIFDHNNNKLESKLEEINVKEDSKENDSTKEESENTKEEEKEKENNEELKVESNSTNKSDNNSNKNTTVTPDKKQETVANNKSSQTTQNNSTPSQSTSSDNPTSSDNTNTTTPKKEESNVGYYDYITGGVKEFNTQAECLNKGEEINTREAMKILEYNSEHMDDQKSTDITNFSCYPSGGGFFLDISCNSGNCNLKYK